MLLRAGDARYQSHNREEFECKHIRKGILYKKEGRWYLPSERGAGGISPVNFLFVFGMDLD